MLSLPNLRTETLLWRILDPQAGPCQQRDVLNKQLFILTRQDSRTLPAPLKNFDNLQVSLPDNTRRI